MRIVHIAPNAPYNEGWGYQENLLTKYQAKSGNDVTLIITTKMHKDGRIINVKWIFRSDELVKIISINAKKIQ